jgi:structural maintenance of chromosome 4
VASEEKIVVSGSGLLTAGWVKADDLQTMATQSDQLRAKVSSSRQKADEAKASLAADKSENAVLASLNKLKAQGRIKGFHVR